MSGRLIVWYNKRCRSMRLTRPSRAGWKVLRRLRAKAGWLASLLGNPVMRPVTHFGYDRFADLLFVWNRWKERW